MNYRELVFRICDVNIYINSMNRDSRLFYFAQEVNKMKLKGYSPNYIQNEAYEQAYFNIIVNSSKNTTANGKIQIFNEIIMPSLVEAGITQQEISLVKRAFDERKLLVHDITKKKRWNDKDCIPVLQY